MKKIVKDGKVLYQWTEKEHKAKIAFEESMYDADQIDEIMKSAVKAIIALRVERARAWDQIKQRIEREFKVEAPKNMTYRWIESAFVADE